MYSMTGFASYKKKYKNISWNIMISTVNSKFLDIRIDGIRDLYLQDVIKSLLKESLVRGRVCLQVYYEVLGKSKIDFKFDDNLLSNYLDECNRVSRKFDIANDLTLKDFVRLREVFKIIDNEDIFRSSNEDDISVVIFELLERLRKNREKEGNKLKKQFIKYIKILKKNAQLLKKYQAEHEKYVKNKIEKKLDELEELDGLEIEKRAIEKELNILLLKGDFEEEIVRIYAHLEEFLNLIEKDGDMGKKMGFMVQELNREFNTLGDKIGSVKGKQIAIESKLIVDRIREQALNIE